ncbi:MAG: sugar ABC transporter ATP-binding protein [Verrucomicrobiota bacterium]
MPSRLQLDGIRKSFGATQALRGVSLSLGPGEAHALIGENGAGKSTLLKILSGVHQADEGSITLDGAEYHPVDPIAAQRSGVAMIHQELNLAPHLSVAENITLGEEPTRWGWVDRSRQRRVATEALQHLGAGDFPLDAIAGELPIAQQQLVEIARALRSKPRVLILDEPTSSLTRADTEHLFVVLDRLREEGVSLLYVSHFLEESRRVCSRFTVLRDGASVATGALAEVSNPELIRVMVGREVHDLYPRSPRSMGESVFRVQALQGIDKPREVTFSLRRGEVLGLFGLVGGGRTETLRAAFGLDALRSGTVRLGDLDISAHTPRERWEGGLGFLSENRKEDGLLLARSIAENLLITRPGDLVRWGFWHPPSEHREAREWMAPLDIRAHSHAQSVHELSGGNQQKVAFGRLMYHDSQVLLLDEPTRGIDVGSKVHIYRQIDAAASQGKAVVMASSYLPELLGVCDTIGVFHRGHLVALRPTADWTEATLLAAAVEGGDPVVGPESE